MLPTDFVARLSETVWDLSADYLLVFNVEFLFPNNHIFTVTKVLSFLYCSHLEMAVFLLGYALCIILLIYSVGFLVVNFSSSTDSLL